jgi:outer membrane protein assembly factor BamA
MPFLAVQSVSQEHGYGLVLAAIAIALALATIPVPLEAQQLRSAVIAAEQAEKAKHLGPGQPTEAERRVSTLRETFLQPRDGLYPYFDSVYGGGGFTLGAGFLRYFGDRSTLDAHGLYSIKNYKLVEVTSTSPGHLSGRLDLDARVGWRDATRVGYYGLGIDTDQDERANYRFKQSYVGGAATLRPARWAVVAGGLGYEHYDLAPGQGSAHPSIESTYTPVSAPGLGADPSFVHSELSGGLDWRTSPGYSRTGGYYGLALHRFSDPDDTFSFSRLDATVVQHIPVLNESWVLSVRGRVQSTLDDDDVVPYFLMPSLGGGSVLRGYSTGRFRDRHALITSAEWRWFPNRTAFDMAFFFDAGTVASRRADLWSERMQTDWGIGGRFHGPGQTPLRLEIAHGSDGWKLVLSGKPAF